MITIYGNADVVGRTIEGEPLVRIRRADLNERGRARWSSGSPCVYLILEQDEIVKVESDGRES